MIVPEEAHEGVHLRNILAAKQTLDRVIREALAAGESWSVIGAALDIGGPEAIRRYAQLDLPDGEEEGTSR